jgi:hypothetical protein
MDPATIAMIASVAGPYLSGLFGGGEEAPQSDEMEKLLGIQRQRMAQAQPLHDSLLKLAMGLMPTYAQSPVGGAQTSTNRVAVPRYAQPRQPQGY